MFDARYAILLGLARSHPTHLFLSLGHAVAVRFHGGPDLWPFFGVVFRCEVSVPRSGPHEDRFGDSSVS